MFASDILRMRATSGSPTIILPTIASMVARYDASTVTGSLNDSIATWPDSFGSFNATEHTAGLGMQLKPAAQNGLNVLQVDVNRFYNLPTSLLNGATAATVMAVIKHDSDPSSSTGAITDGFGTGTTSHHPFSDNVIYDSFGTSARKTVGDPTPNLATTYRIYGIRSASADYTFHLDGTSLLSTGTNTVAINGTGVGSRYLGANALLTILTARFAEVAFFNAALNTSDRQKMEGYLAWKWGIVANLPGGHPYLSAPP